MITKVPSRPKGYVTKLKTLLSYLENNDNKRREDVMLIDGYDVSITPVELYAREYWHGIIAPSQLECCELTEHYTSDDYRYAAIKHGQLLVDKLQSELDFDHNISIAIHWRKNRDNTVSWHYHLVGLGEPTSRLDGHSGALQTVWRKASVTQDKPIVNEAENLLALAEQEILVELNKQTFNLTRVRYKAIKAATSEEKVAIRASFNDAEIDIVNQRFNLQNSILEHHYAARNDSASIGHQIAKQNNDNERSLSLTRVTNRGFNRETIIANKRELNKIAAAERRATIQTYKDIKCVKGINKIRKNRALKVVKLGENTLRKTTKIAISLAAIAADKINDIDQTIAKDRITEGSNKIIDLTTSAVDKAAKETNKTIKFGIKLAHLSARKLKKTSKMMLTTTAVMNAVAATTNAVVVGTKSMINRIRLALPIPGVISNTSSNYSNSHNVVNRTNDVSLPSSTSNNFEAALAKYRAGLQKDDRDKRERAADLGRLPASTHTLIDMAVSTTKTGVSVAKNVVTLSPIQTTTSATLGGLDITNKAIGTVGKGTQTLPAGIKIPLQVAGLVPVVATLTRAITLTAETTLTVANVSKHSNDYEFEL